MGESHVCLLVLYADTVRRRLIPALLLGLLVQPCLAQSAADRAIVPQHRGVGIAERADASSARRDVGKSSPTRTAESTAIKRATRVERVETTVEGDRGSARQGRPAFVPEVYKPSQGHETVSNFKLPSEESTKAAPRFSAGSVAALKDEPGHSASAVRPADVQALRSRQTLEVLRRHGIADDAQARAAGLPAVILTDRRRVDEVLKDLRTVNPPRGNGTLYQRRLPETHDGETTEALAALCQTGAIAGLTGSALLLNDNERRSAQQRCINAATALDAQEANVRTIGSAEPGVTHGSAEFWRAIERLNANAATAYRQSAQAYATACLDAEWHALTLAQRSDMKSVVGFLHLNGVAECMGTRVAADRFLTARHCLYRYDRNIGWERHDVTSVQVALAIKPGVAFDAEELDCDAPQPDRYCSVLSANDALAADHLVLRLKPPSPGAAFPAMPALQVDRAGKHQMLVVPGRSTWITGRALSATDPVYVTTAGIGGCMVATNDQGCLVNSCQSEPGFSGAPMFARRDVGQLVLVGIFLGSTAQSPYPHCQWSNRNFGATLPLQVAKALR